MTRRIAAWAAAIGVAGFVLTACVSQSVYDEQAAQLKEAQAQVAAQQEQITKMQSEDRWVMAGDLLFPEGGYQLTPAGQAALSEHVPQLKSVQKIKVVVYGFTDNTPVGSALRRAGIADNLDLSSRRAATVVAYLRSQGINPNILSAKGFGETHPVAPNETPEGRAQNRRIEIVLEGPGA